MGGFGYLWALGLAAVLVRAGAAKLARRDETEAGFGAMRLPAARPLAVLVPLVELAVAVLLVGVPRVGGVAALVLLGAFTAVLVKALRSGVRGGCNCFGAARAEPVSAVDVVRNGMLAALAVGALLAPAPQAPSVVEAVVAGGLATAGAVVLRMARATRRGDTRRRQRRPE